MTAHHNHAADTMPGDRNYLPAAGHDWALPLYDLIVTLVGGNPTRGVLIEQARIGPGERVLDIGCGTGTMAVRVKQTHPDAEVVGLDPDPKALARARRKADGAGVNIHFDVGFAGSLPFADASFDRVLSSFMFHHLPQDEKDRMLREAHRVLRPGGSFHMVDFGGSDSVTRGRLSRRLHANDHFRDNRVDEILALMEKAGFNAQRVATGTMLFGQLGVNYFWGGLTGGQEIRR